VSTVLRGADPTLAGAPKSGFYHRVRRLLSMQRGAPTGAPVDAGERFDLVDVSRLDVGQLCAMDDSVFAHSMRRILEDVDQPNEAVAGWNAAIG
jgi:FXSXX-COOH protein